MFVAISASAQEVLMLQDAIQKALEKNHNIKIARNNQQIQDNNATRGNAGMLPSLNLSSSYDYSSTDTEQEFLTSLDAPTQKVNVNGAETERINSALNFEYTIFNGFLNQILLRNTSSMLLWETYRLARILKIL